MNSGIYVEDKNLRRISMSVIRDIENIIDHYHENHAVLKKQRNQALLDTLRVFEDACRLSSLSMAVVASDMMEGVHRAYMDALNIAIQWIYSECPNNDDSVSMQLSSETYQAVSDLLLNHAVPYSGICAGYIGYSRKQFSVEVQGNNVTFISDKKQDELFCANMAELYSKRKKTPYPSISIPSEIIEIITKAVHFKDGRICYELTSEVLNAFKPFAEMQWEATSTLPKEWEFDRFTLDDYKKVWIIIDTLCMIHFNACINSNVQGCAVEDNIIVINRNSLVNSLKTLSTVSEEVIDRILSFITYNPNIKNTDIMYQPIVELDKYRVVITPHLFMSSNPERNLMAIINKSKDRKHSIEVNQLENLMLGRIKNQIPITENLIVCSHVDIGAELPDIDFGLYDKTTNSAIICELKWLIEADSPQEVFAREDDIERGCQQIRDIMSFAVCNREYFFRKLFNIDEEYTDLFYCVIAKNDIRSRSTDIPVISESAFIRLMNTLPVNSAFHKIRNKEFYEAIPCNLKMGHQSIDYAGYTFNIPAIVQNT